MNLAQVSAPVRGNEDEVRATRTWTTRRLVLAVAIVLGIVVVQVGWRSPTAGPAAYRTARPSSGPSAASGRARSSGNADLARLLPAPLARDVMRLRAAPMRYVSEPRDAAIVDGVAFGRTDAIDPADKQAFLTSGLWHLLAASGQNVALVAMLCLGVAWLLGAGRVAGTVIALLAVPAYVVVTGGGPSIERAGIMGELALLAWLAGSLFDVVDAMLVAAALLVWLEPGIASTLGFQLSFACVVALLTCCRPIADWLRRHRCPAMLADGTAATLACSAATAPILLHVTGAAPVGGAIANLVAVPAAGVLLVVALAASLVEPFLPDAARVGYVTAGQLAHFLRATGHVAADLPLASVHSWPGLAAVVAACIAIVLAIERGPSIAASAASGTGPSRHVPAARRRRALSLVLATSLLAGCAVGAWAVARARRPPRVPAGALRVSVLDVGQGDAILLQAAGHAVLVDTGPPAADVVAIVHGRGVRRLDGVVATHYQLDHVGNLERVARDLHPAWVAWPRTGPGPWRQLQLSGARSLAVCAGSTRGLGAATLLVLHPGCAHAIHRTSDEFNDNAIVLLVRIGGQRVLLTADAESPAIGAVAAGPVDLLKVAHHGSGDPGLPAWLDRLRPRVAAISVGARNTYGHPAPSTLDALVGHGVQVARTDRSGTLAWQLDGRHLRRLQ